MSAFPLIFYPKPVEEFLQSIASKIQNIPPLPEPPTLKTVTAKTHLQHKNKTALLTLAIALNFVFLAVAILGLTNLSWWILVLLVLSCISTLIILWREASLGQFYQKYHPDQEASRLKEYERQLKDYRKARAERMKIEQQHHKAIDAYRKKLTDVLSQSLLLPVGNSVAQQGASEERFKLYLDRYFPGYIHQGFQLSIPDSDLFYSADFTYVDKSLNLYIDIEIDEPYYYKTKEPTHCSDQDKDKKRNTFFLKNNWIVIRFAEEQIVCYPNRCCKNIAKVVAEITGYWEVFNKFKDVPNLPPIKHWTTREARKMARANYRNRYLK